MNEYTVYKENRCVGKEYIEEIWNSDILQMNVCNIIFEHEFCIDIKYDVDKKTLIYYRVYERHNNKVLCELEYVEKNTYIVERRTLWRVNKSIIPYELAKYKMPMCIEMSVGGFIPYYDITKNDMLYLSVRKKSPCSYQILSPEYSELLYEDQVLDKYINGDFYIIRK